MKYNNKNQWDQSLIKSEVVSAYYQHYSCVIFSLMLNRGSGLLSQIFSKSSKITRTDWE